jgi:hypothetical protein
MAAKAKNGSERRQRVRIIPVRCTEAEYAAIHALAEASDLPAGAFLRAAAFGTPGPRAQKRPPVDRQELARLLGQLGKIGGNLNQIARALNQRDYPPIDEIKSALAAVTESRASIRKAIGIPDDH